MSTSVRPPVALLSPAPPPRSGAVAAGGQVERLLRPFGDVRAGEGLLVALMAANLFLLLAGYYILKTVREPLILAGGGAELKSYAAAAQALSLVAFVPLYGWFAARVSRRGLLVGLSAFFIVHIQVFAIGLIAGHPFVGPSFYVWVGIFSLATIAQFWSYANDALSREAGERLFPLIAVGATMGSPAGAWLAQRLFDAGVPAWAMLEIAAVTLLAHAAVALAIDGRLAASPAAGRGSSPQLPPGGGGFRLVWSNSFLRLVALFLLCLNIVNTVGEYIVSRSVLDAAAAAVRASSADSIATFVGSFYGGYFFWVNIVAILVQALLASRVVRRWGVAGVVMALPLVAFGAYGLMGLGAGFAAVRWAKTLENATDYSLMNTGRQLLWLPTTRDQKYAAKQAIDTFFVRAGDVVAAGTVFAGTAVVGLTVEGFARFNLAVVLGWMLLGAFVVREYRRRCADCP